MRYERSGGFLSRDWQFILALQFGLPATIMFLVPIPLLLGARQGDLTGFWIALASALVRVVLLFIAKWPLYRQGRYFTFGSKSLPEGRRPLYRLAYVFIATSLLRGSLLLVALR